MYWGGLIGVNGAFQAVIYRNVNGTLDPAQRPHPHHPGDTSSNNTLLFDVVGPSLKLFVNGTLAAFANDTMLTAARHGGAAAAAPASASPTSRAFSHHHR